MRFCLAILGAAILLSGVASPQDDTPAGPSLGATELAALAEAYQTGYLQVVAIACFQLYSSTGVVATDFANGYIAQETALSALEHNSLLHSACLTTLTEIESLTPPDDAEITAELSRLHSLLDAEDELIAALTDTITEPTDENSRKVEAARQRVEDELDRYANRGE